MIIKAMAITRCPYCHAITDENDKYCNNCGTQLLFPEDDEVDEEIPGEKIVDAEVEEKDYTVDEPEDEKRPETAKDLEMDIDEDLEREMKDKAAETALDELVAEGALKEESGDLTEEVILVDEAEAAGKDKGGTGSLAEEAEPGRKDEPAGEDRETDEEEELDEEDLEEEEEEDEEEEKEEEEEEDEEEEEGEAEEKGIKVVDAEEEEEGKDEDEDKELGDEHIENKEDTGEPTSETAEEKMADVEAVEYIAPEPSPSQSITFDTRELEKLGRTVELGKDKIDKFIEDMVDKKPAEAPPPVTEPAAAPAAAGIREPTGSLPPWASTMKGAPVFLPDTGKLGPAKGISATPAQEVEVEEEEVEIFPRRQRDSDSTIGLPERVSQAPLPFERKETGEVEAVEEGVELDEAVREPVLPQAEPVRPVRPPFAPAERPEIEPMEEYEETGPRPPFSFSVFFKSKAFDVLFVGLFWLVALWLAAHAMDQTLFEILGAVSGTMLLLYAVFGLLYFFLFRFFLGETLGDRLFRPRNETPEERD
jgi:hypothetical protein